MARKKKKKASKKTSKKKTKSTKKTTSKKKTTKKKQYDDILSLKLWLILVVFLLVLGLILSNLYWKQNQKMIINLCQNVNTIGAGQVVKSNNVNKKVSMSNPASEYCLQSGGELEIQKKSDGSQYGICVFPNGNKCEEWALLKGECPAQGVDTSSYRTVLESYCAITGGEVDEENYKCIFSENKSCDLEAYYKGRCR